MPRACGGHPATLLSDRCSPLEQNVNQSRRPVAVPMSEKNSEQHRQQLLQSLFGVDVPTGLSSTLLRTSDVAALFQVSERTISDWARRGRIPSVRTPGGHRRYPAEEIRRIMREADWDTSPADDTPKAG